MRTGDLQHTRHSHIEMVVVNTAACSQGPPLSSRHRNRRLRYEMTWQFRVFNEVYWTGTRIRRSRRSRRSRRCRGGCWYRVAVAVGVGGVVGVDVTLGVDVIVGVGVIVGVAVIVGVGVMVGVTVIVGVGVNVGVSVGVSTYSTFPQHLTSL